MTARARKEIGLLAVLLAVLATLVYRSQSAGPATGAPGPSNPSAQANQMAANADPVPDVRLELLTGDDEAFTPPRRDPFRFRPKPPPVTRQLPPPPVFMPPPDPGPPPGPAPASMLRYVGYLLLPTGQPVASLQVGPVNTPGVVLFVGREGDIIEGQYRLVRITEDNVEVVELGGRQRRALIPRVPQPRS